MDMENNILIIDDTKYETMVTEKFKNRTKYEDPDPKKLLSFIPGTIYKINVREGENVREGSPLLVLEAMKMKNTISAPMTGVIKKIRVKEGERVPKNHILLEYL